MLGTNRIQHLWCILNSQRNEWVVVGVIHARKMNPDSNFSHFCFLFSAKKWKTPLMLLSTLIRRPVFLRVGTKRFLVSQRRMCLKCSVLVAQELCLGWFLSISDLSCHLTFLVQTYTERWLHAEAVVNQEALITNNIKHFENVLEWSITTNGLHFYTKVNQKCLI